MKRIAIFGNSYQSAYTDLLRRLFSGLTNEIGARLSFEQSYRSYLLGILGNDPIVCVSDVLTTSPTIEADLVLSIGGDGTFLHTANSVSPTGIPIMGINAGHLGYLSAAPLSEVDEIIDDIAAGRYIVEPRAMLNVASDSLRLPPRPYALNEVTVMRQETASMISVEARLNGECLGTYKGDGLIISTPTGSTAYNLSAGGPILAPDVANWIITPVAPHSLTMRPLVVSADTRIDLTVTSRSTTISLSIDGRSWAISNGAQLTIDRAPHLTNVVRLRRHTFIDTLRNKLLWGAAGK